MAYTHTKQMVQMTDTAVLVNSTGVKGNKWTPGIIPYVVRGFAMTNTSGLTDLSALVVNLENTVLTGPTTNVLATLKGTTAAGSGTVIFKKGLNVQINPGEELSINVTTAATVAATMQFTVLMEPKWETDENITVMKATL